MMADGEPRPEDNSVYARSECALECTQISDRRRERLEIATAAMQAYIIVNRLRRDCTDVTDLWTNSLMASWAIDDADVLLAEAEKEAT